ncbi:MAG: hypothetical protein AAF316_10990 [Cyanobacteria bacterium P01_A01_bin.80]
MNEGIKLVRKGKVKEAIAVYKKALKFDPNLQISVQEWNTLCWFGSLNNHARDVMFACEKAVALAPRYILTPTYQIIDSRGLARALTEDYKGAIEDFEIFVKQTDDSKDKSQRQSWINDLREGKNPFTPEVLDKLRKP